MKHNYIEKHIIKIYNLYCTAGRHNFQYMVMTVDY